MRENNRSYSIITFGCQMNEHDSELISGMLSQRGYTELDAENRSNADIVIINTCSIRENADKRFFGTLGQLKKIKAKNPELAVCVCGCMMQQEHISTKLRRSYPWVDVIFGTHNIHEFPDMLEEMYANRRALQKEKADKSTANTGKRDAMAKHDIRSSKEIRVDRVYEDSDKIVEGLPAKRLFEHKSFVNIMYGCNNFCTYCIVPYTRGREKSRDPKEIIREVKALVADGVKEVSLLGQNVNSYKGESEGKKCDFTDLIYELAEIAGLERIRFMTSHPKDLSPKLIEAFAKCDKLCNYIHLPVQAGSTAVLKRMNRKYSRESYLNLIRALREAVPEIAISTDIIVGFPGETESEFEETLTLAKEVQYDSAFTFLYSPRKGTPAAEYGNQIPDKIKHERFNRLVDLMNEASKNKNAAYVGKSCRVLVDGLSRKTVEPENETAKAFTSLNGRTPQFKSVDFTVSEDDLSYLGLTMPEELIGQIIDVEVNSSNTFSLRGRIAR